jgi:hypothetical protein
LYFIKDELYHKKVDFVTARVVDACRLTNIMLGGKCPSFESPGLKKHIKE